MKITIKRALLALALVAGVAGAQTKIDLPTQTKGVLPIANGGTNTTTATGTGDVVLKLSPTLSTPTLNTPTFVAPALGTPTSGVMTNVTGTAAGLTAGNVTTNANLTGPITSSGNATALAAQTGTGSVFVVQSSPTINTPTFVAPALGTPLSGVMTNVTAIPAGQISGVIPIANLATGTPTGSKFIRDDGTLQTVASGSGDFVGPASSTDNALVRFDGTTGKLGQNGTATLSDAGSLDLPQAVAATSTDGLILETTTAATVGAQKYSPRTRWRGFGWGTTASSSQPIDFTTEVRPVQGTVPTGMLVVSGAVNGGAYSDFMTIKSDGLINFPFNNNISFHPSATLSGGTMSAAGFYITGKGSISASAIGNFLFDNDSGHEQVKLWVAANGTWQWGGSNAASPVAQIFQFQGSRGGTDTNVAAVAATIQGSLGTGTGTVGDLVFKTGTVAASGTTQHTAATRLTLNSASAAFAVPVTSTSSFNTATNGTKSSLRWGVGTVGNNGVYSRGAGTFNIVANGNDVVEIVDSLGFLATTNSPQYGWTGSATAGSANRTALAENASGVVEINNGTACSTASNCRDLKLRHVIAGGTAPTVGGSCGTSPTITGGDNGFQVTTGTGAPTSCTITFGTAYASAPTCVPSASATTTALNMATTTTTAIVSSAALTASEVLHVICIGI